MQREAVILSALLASVLLAGAPVHAAPAGGEASPITDRFALRAGYFRGSVDTAARLDAAAGRRGTPFSAEADLGLDDRVDQGRIELVFRLRERHRLRADYVKVNRHARRALPRTLDFGDETFLAGEQVTASFDWRMLGFTYYGSVLRRERVEIGAGLGVHLIEARAYGEAPARFAREDASGVAPFPTIALDGTWRVTERVSLSGRGQWLQASVDEFDGALGDYHLDVQYRWRPNLAFGVGYGIMRARLDVQDADFPGRLDLDVRGPGLFFRASF